MAQPLAISASTVLPPIIQEALSVPSGAHFYRCAFQVNPYHYAQTYRGQAATRDEASYIRELIATALRLDIRVLVVTDHNHVGSIERIREAACQHDIVVFPGFEMSSSEGVHILCLYPPETSVETLNRYLGEFGIRDTDPTAQLSTRSLSELLKLVLDQGGITIAAHITESKGLLTCLRGQARIKAWKDPNLLAVQIPGRITDLPQDKKQIVCNKAVEYRREPSPTPDLAIAVLNAKDIVTPEDLADPTATSWIKMSTISIEGLRQAFLDPTSRIRLNTDPPREEHAEFVAMTWQGGFLDGEALHFNDNLNVLIGGRGAGKSTVIESLRYVLGLEPLSEDARKAHEGNVRHVLKSGTKISLLVRSYHPAKREYLIERTIPNPPVVRDDTGKLLALNPSDVMPRAEVYGQHEISDLTKSPEKLTRLLERFVERNATLPTQKNELTRQLDRSRSRIIEVRQELAEIEDRLGSLPALEETLLRFQEAGVEERLKEQSLLVREERVMKTAPERLSPFRDLLEQLRRELPIDRTFVSPKALEPLPGKESIADIDKVLETVSQELLAAVDRAEQALQHADARLDLIRIRWEERKRQVQSAYEKILRDLQKSKIDGQEFIQLRHAIEELRPLRDRQSMFDRNLKDLETQRRSLLAEWDDIKAEEFRQIERAAKKVSRLLGNRVRATPTFAGNRQPLSQHLRERVGGRLSEAIERLEKCESLSLTELAEASRSGRDALVQKFGLPASQADRLAQAPLEAIMEIEELDLPATTRIELNIGGEAQAPIWQALEDLSTGQKATAVLLLLLLESDAPLIVDQPEDDLDNRFITEGIVPKMREEKRRRQFIFATHNANIPVLGDAELIAGLSAVGEAGMGRAHISRDHIGSIDARPVRELVEEILEGGKTAFEWRRLKYGF